MSSADQYMARALKLAKRGYGATSPNPMVGALLVKRGQIIGRGWHQRAGLPHAEIEALDDARRRGHSVKGATLFVTLEPCCTQGRTPPCTKAIIAAGIRRVIVGAVDPNPRHAGRGLKILRAAGLIVQPGVCAKQCEDLNEAFNFWIVHRRPFVTVKAGMTLDGKIAAPNGESKWITGGQARNHAMKLRQGADAIVVGINTVEADDPELTIRLQHRAFPGRRMAQPRRIVLDARARTALNSKLVNDNFDHRTTIVVSKQAPARRIKALADRVQVVVAPARNGHIDLPWLLKKLGAEEVTSLLVEGGGEVNASFLLPDLAQRVAFFYAPKILGGANARKAVGGHGAKSLQEAKELTDVEWRRVGIDWLLTARIRTKSD